MKSRFTAEKLEWIQKKATFDELVADYPQEWAAVQSDLSKIYASGNIQTLRECLDRSSTQGLLVINSIRKNQGNRKAWETALPQLIRNRMIQMATQNYCLASATGIIQGKVRFNYLNGQIAQMLLFSHDLERKPVSLFWFRFIWPFIWQKRFLMPLVQPKGIYCFYSRSLIVALAKMMAGRACLEIAAGDGTLTRFLTNAGVTITATDDKSWNHAIQYPEWVVKQDAKMALHKYAPEIVICSWPPANNTFERHVFKTTNVQRYIVIGSRYKFASGNWSDYHNQSDFTLEEAQNLSRLVLPPELSSAVYLFRRKSSNSVRDSEA